MTRAATEIAVTNHRVVIKRGWLTRSTTEQGRAGNYSTPVF
ncbi:MAG: hypothetical protein ACLPJW_18415 [Rhodomicrobium sp.]